MAQTKKKRRRKHSGTQAGTVQRQASGARPQSKEEKREAARQRRLERMNRPPTWRGSLTRAAVAAAIFAVVVAVFLRPTVLGGVATVAFMFLLYIPISYYTDLFIYRRRQKGGGQAKAASSKRSRGERG